MNLNELRTMLKAANLKAKALCDAVVTAAPTLEQEREIDLAFFEVFKIEDEMRKLDPRCLPPVGSWADVARTMAQDDDSGMDWDAWKDQMKESDF
jgi:hypothetical protein